MGIMRRRTINMPSEGQIRIIATSLADKLLVDLLTDEIMAERPFTGAEAQQIRKGYVHLIRQGLIEALRNNPELEPKAGKRAQQES